MPSLKRGIRAATRSILVLLTTSLLVAGCGSGTVGDQGTQTAPTAAAAVATSATATPTPTLGGTPPARPLPYQAPGVTYNGLHATESPTTAQVTSDLTQVKTQGFKTIRTYYPQYMGGQIDVDGIAKAQGLGVVLGLYIFDNPQWTEGDYSTWVKAAIEKQKNVLAVIIGNEDPQHLDTIIHYLKQMKTDHPGIPVSTAQKTDFWLSDSRAQQVLPYVDFIAANVYPSWDWTHPVDLQPAIGVVPVTPDAGFQTFTQTYGQLQAKYSGYQIVVTETGWPTTYGKVNGGVGPSQPAAGITNAKAYLDKVIAWAGQNSVNVYIYDMFDDLYGVDASSDYNYHFGLIDWQGKAKGILF